MSMDRSISRRAPGTTKVRYDQRPELGTVVHLAPVTRLAGQLEHTMAPVRVVGYDWPHVIVDTDLNVPLPGQEDERQHHRVFHQNLLLHPRKQIGAGDQAATEERRIPRPLPGRPKPIDIPDGQEQGAFW